ncbi:MAG: hypothetical protein PHT07_17380 [Paludibacter sp.]|nr:hypothetical protein [Paludibacter sp.]
MKTVVELKGNPAIYEIAGNKKESDSIITQKNSPVNTGLFFSFQQLPQ